MMRIKQKMQGYFKLFVVVLYIGCTANKKTSESSISFKNFDIIFSSDLPKPLISESLDGDEGSIVLAQDTIRFAFGHRINNLSEKDPVVIYFPHNKDSLIKNLDTTLINPSGVVYTRKINFDIDEFRKQNVFFEKIGNLVAKITVPRRADVGGITGMYIDSLTSNEGGRWKFSIYAVNLDSTKQKSILNSLRTIKFKLE